MIEYKVQVIGRKCNYLFAKEYDEMCDYTDLEIITQILNENKQLVKYDEIYTIIVWKFK